MNDLELEITSKAYNDLEIILDYIAKDNKTAATKFVRLFNNLSRYLFSIVIVKLIVKNSTIKCFQHKITSRNTHGKDSFLLNIKLLKFLNILF